MKLLINHHHNELVYNAAYTQDIDACCICSFNFIIWYYYIAKFDTMKEYYRITIL